MRHSRALARLPASPVLDGRFLLLEALGRGGMGRVYRAFDRLAERLVALKVVDRAEPGGTAHREFGAWSRLRHPNIVRAYEVARARGGPIAAGTPYLVLEHVSGAPVHRVLSPGWVPPLRLAGFARKVLRALGHVHAAGLVHRDVKPGNVLFATARGDSVKLTDFGLVVRIGDSRPAGRVSGSLPYVAPETILGRPVDGRADLYGLGILLYYLATGRMPAPTSDPSEIIRWHLDGPDQDPRSVAPALPAPLARLIRSLMTRSPGDRPKDARAALAFLEETEVGDPNGCGYPPIGGGYDGRHRRERGRDQRDPRRGELPCLERDPVQDGNELA